MTPGAWFGFFIVPAALCAALAALSALGDRCSAEAKRKALHLGMGLVTLALPWLFNEAWPVIALGGILAALFVALRLYPPLHGVGRVLHGVGRDSFGEFFFVLGVCLLFVFAAGDTLLFLIPMLILTLADTAAALVGNRFGSRHYSLGAGRKSVEGSVAFSATAFCCACVPLWMQTPHSLIESAGLALAVTGVATLSEALVGRGLDNLTVPLGASAALAVVQHGNATALTVAAFSAVAVVFVTAWLQKPELSRHEYASSARP